MKPSKNLSKVSYANGFKSGVCLSASAILAFLAFTDHDAEPRASLFWGCSAAVMAFWAGYHAIAFQMVNKMQQRVIKHKQDQVAKCHQQLKQLQAAPKAQQQSNIWQK